MMLPPATRVYLACGFTDMRKGFDGLAAIVQTGLALDPYGGALFLFRGRRGDLVKALHWAERPKVPRAKLVEKVVEGGQGLCLYAKRLENGRFVWPPIVDGQMTLTPAQLALLLEAMDWRRTVALEQPRKPVMV